MAPSHDIQLSSVQNLSPPQETMASTEIAPSPRLSLLDVPPELRLMIYRHVWGSIYEDLATLGMTCKEIEPTGLLESCHLIR